MVMGMYKVRRSPGGLSRNRFKGTGRANFLLLTTLCLGIGSSSAALGFDCADLGDAASNYLSDRQLFARIDGVWRPFTTVPSLSLPKRTTLDFAVAIQPNSGRDRAGVVVIKSNRAEKVGDRPELAKTITLVRRQVQADSTCSDHRRFRALREFEESVSIRAYEDFHDYRYKDTPALREHETKLTEFHFPYFSGVRGRCVTTDDANSDTWNIPTSNRSQFSYDETVVANGRYDPGKSFPSKFAGYTDNKTIVKRYQTVRGLTCVGFRLEVDAEDYIIRVNDLEGREQPPSNSRERERRYPN